MTCRIVLTGVHSPPLHLPLVKVSLEDAAAGRGGELALAMHGAVLKVALVRLARRQLELPEAMVLALTVPLANIRLGSLILALALASLSTGRHCDDCFDLPG